jgi:hypothetical protein
MRGQSVNTYFLFLIFLFFPFPMAGGRFEKLRGAAAAGAGSGYSIPARGRVVPGR